MYFYQLYFALSITFEELLKELGHLANGKLNSLVPDTVPVKSVQEARDLIPFQTEITKKRYQQRRILFITSE